MRISLCSSIALALGILLDLLLGDPNYAWHPIRLIGGLISFLERKIRAALPKKARAELAGGALLVIAVLAVSVVLPTGLLVFVYRWNRAAGLLAEAVFCYQLLAAKSLKTESMKVYTALKEHGLEAGRAAVSMIVGRDTGRLNETGVIKAAVETVAENTSDGVIAPLLFMAVLGAPAGFFYKAVNTMDSMIGYKNDKYLYFGRAAARLDDLCNYIPSRISALLMIAVCPLLGFSGKGAYQIWKRDSRNHKSPNSAQTEAACAGALGIELAGDAWYFGKLYKKPTIGDPLRPAELEDIKRANRLMYGAAAAGAVLFLAVRMAALW